MHCKLFIRPFLQLYLLLDHCYLIHAITSIQLQLKFDGIHSNQLEYTGVRFTSLEYYYSEFIIARFLIFGLVRDYRAITGSFNLP